MQPVAVRRSSWLPRPGSAGYHALLVAVALFVLGPLGGITAAYMNFSLGFFVGGQVLAGILGSAVTYGYGAEGKHGANYMQTLAASVASMSGMCVLVQAMVWLGMPLPAPWKLVAFFFCVGMFGVGVGMLYTPLLVDRLQLEYPSGHAVANILRALTNPRLLRRSIGKLGGGTLAGAAAAALVERVRVIGSTHISASTIGAGLVVGSRNTFPAAIYGALGFALTPGLRANGWLGPQDPFRKIGFLAALAMILGAALVDLTLVAVETVRRLRASSHGIGVAGGPGLAVPSTQAGSAGRPRPVDAHPATTPSDPRGNSLGTRWLLTWSAFWATALVMAAHFFLGQPVGWMVFAVALSGLFVYINGVSNGITDSNPISSAFVVSVLLMSALGLANPVAALIASSVLLLSCAVGVDMQQDRSTGWRLGTNRVVQFRYQVMGVAMGAVLCVVLARLFIAAYPVLAVDSYAHPETDTRGWQSAMTFKLVGAIRDLGQLPPHKAAAIGIGLALGFAIELCRKLLRRSARYAAFVKRDRKGRATGWVMDAVVLPSPYAASFGGFVDLAASCWFAVGGLINAAIGSFEGHRRQAGAGNLRPDGVAPPSDDRGATADPGRAPEVGHAGRDHASRQDKDALPEDMSTASLVGGGLIAGESLFALAIGVYGLLHLL